jgi:hypothetical protein
MNDLDHFNAPKMGGKASPALGATPRCQADRIPYLFRSTQGACFGVRQLAAALNRAEFLQGSLLPSDLPNRNRPS